MNEIRVRHVRVGSGTKVHFMLLGDSSTLCGQWIGQSSIWEVDDPVTCNHCLKNWPGLVGVRAIPDPREE